MLYLLSKILGQFLEPSSLILLLLISSSAFFLARRSKSSLLLLLFNLGVLVAVAWTPIGSWIMRPLENRFPPTPLPSRISGIIVLGGAFDVAQSDAHGWVALNYRADRMIAFAGLARKYPNASLIFTGGKAQIYGKPISEAEIARKFFLDLGIDLRRVIFEGESRNTHENAIFSRRLVRLNAGDKWLLVTSAADLPRAIGTFEAIGWNVVPVPVDYHTTDNGWSAPGLVGGFQVLDWAAHEWIGLLYYRLEGWTNTLFPGPTSKDVPKSSA